MTFHDLPCPPSQRSSNQTTRELTSNGFPKEATLLSHDDHHSTDGAVITEQSSFTPATSSNFMRRAPLPLEHFDAAMRDRNDRLQGEDAAQLLRVELIAGRLYTVCAIKGRYSNTQRGLLLQPSTEPPRPHRD